MQTWDGGPTRRFTIDEVYRMQDSGVPAPDERIELLDGRLVVVSPQGEEHASFVAHWTRPLDRAYLGIAHVRCQAPLNVDPYNHPEPELLVARGEALDWRAHHRTGRSTLLAVELSATSHRRDRWMAGLYAATGVPEYWLVDLPARRVVVHRDPDGSEGYRWRQILGPEQELELPALGETRSIAELLPE